MFSVNKIKGILLIFFIWGTGLYSQSEVKKDTGAKNLHSFTYEPLSGLGYSISFLRNDAMYLYVGVTSGLIMGANFKFGYSYLVDNYVYKEYFRLSVLQQEKNRHVLFGYGGFMSLGTGIRKDEGNILSFGGQFMVSYGSENIKIGHSLQLGFMNRFSIGEFEPDLYPAILITPIFLSICF